MSSWVYGWLCWGMGTTAWWRYWIELIGARHAWEYYVYAYKRTHNGMVAVLYGDCNCNCSLSFSDSIEIARSMGRCRLAQYNHRERSRYVGIFCMYISTFFHSILNNMDCLCYKWILCSNNTFILGFLRDTCTYRSAEPYENTWVNIDWFKKSTADSINVLSNDIIRLCSRTSVIVVSLQCEPYSNKW